VVGVLGATGHVPGISISTFGFFACRRVVMIQTAGGDGVGADEEPHRRAELRACDGSAHTRRGGQKSGRLEGRRCKRAIRGFAVEHSGTVEARRQYSRATPWVIAHRALSIVMVINVSGGEDGTGVGVGAAAFPAAPAVLPFADVMARTSV